MTLSSRTARRPVGAMVAVAAAAAILVACGDDNDITEPDPTLHLAGEVQGLEGWEQLEGFATASWIPGEQSFTTTMEISGDEEGESRPWHVHLNTCAEGGPIVGLDPDYPRLVIEEDGTASVATTVPTTLDPEQSYHVNVHLAEFEQEEIIACGDLEVVDNNGSDD